MPYQCICSDNGTCVCVTQEAETIHVTAKSIMTNLTTLKDDFTAVVIRFCAWITATIEALVKAIKSALEQLERDLERLRRAAAAAIIGGMLADAGAPVSNVTELEASSVRP